MARDPGVPSCECGGSLATSVYIVTAGRLRKSCALCSRLAGAHVFHLIAEFGWHCPTHDEGMPYPQSECLASWGPRIEAAVVTTAPLEELREKLAGFPIVGMNCTLVRATGETPRPPHDPAIAEYLEPLRQEAADAFLANLTGADGPRDPRPARVKRCRQPEITGPTSYSYNPDRAPRPYDQAERYNVGDRVVHPIFGVCLVVLADRKAITVATPDKLRLLVHDRTVEVRHDLIELVRLYGEPLSIAEVADYCAIEIDDALRQMNALVRAGLVARVGVCQYTYLKESRAA